MANDYHHPTVGSTDDQGNQVPNRDASKTEIKPAGITVTFKDAGGGEVSFKLKATTKLKKAMDAYSARAEREAKFVEVSV